jgi:formylmethanofuran--tetrahydromethanopterin N-formyltransferase
MDGWMHVAAKFGVMTAVTGGMFLILGATPAAALEAAEAALAAASAAPMVVVKCAASGSKVGALNYAEMVATTNHYYCPTLVGAVADSKIPSDVGCVYEIIISGAREADVRAGMRLGIEAATTVSGVRAIHTANYDGKLGKGKIHLHSLFQ